MTMYKDSNDLPATLNAGQVAKYLGISRASGYSLLNDSQFPTLKIGKRLVVPKEAFILWIEANIRSGKPTE